MNGAVAETALVFGRLTEDRFREAGQLLGSLPGLCDGLLVECDVACRATPPTLVAIARLSREEAVVAARVAFWTWRAGGHIVPLAALPPKLRAGYHALLQGCDAYRCAVPPPSLSGVLTEIAVAAGIRSFEPGPARAKPVLSLRGGRPLWDGAAFDRRTARLFLPTPVAPVLGDEFLAALQLGSEDATECLVQVVEVSGPGQRGPGLPAGVVLELLGPPPHLIDALDRTLNGGDGDWHRKSPRLRVGMPVVVHTATPATSEAAAKGEDAWIDDLSQGGAYVRTERPLPPGTELRLDVRLPTGARLDAPATVVRAEASGMGVRFRLDEGGEKTLGAAMAYVAARPRRALVVDDDALARKIVATELEERGFEVLTAADGLAGLQLLTDEMLALDLLVADLRMPNMDGPSLLDAVRRLGGEHELAVVMITATVDPFLRAHLKDKGADAVLDKALGADGIAAACDATVARRQLETLGSAARS
jgi:CheY-like chemotaxis protein